MHFGTIFGLFLAALVAAAPPHNPGAQRRGLVTIVMSEPDCNEIKDYCTNCNGDFNCESDPRCEWCYENGGFGDTI
ncbi:hypothetical protein F5Y19DRAFT_29555 [Xylariaceae sp. FL1651]|nr:hypothetical protein F5Y19DRAFT_29555 [Xylariaceae sp. FL1651]